MFIKQCVKSLYSMLGSLQSFHLSCDVVMVLNVVYRQTMSYSYYVLKVKCGYSVCQNLIEILKTLCIILRAVKN